jgi:lipopolysaccharide export system protein LptC
MTRTNAAMTESQNRSSRRDSARRGSSDLAFGTAEIRSKSPFYSRFVTSMKIILPSVAISIVAIVLIWPQLTGKDERFQLSFSKLNQKDVDLLTMVNARYHGVDAKNQPFTVTADTANENASKKAKVVDLDHPTADLTTKDGSWLTVSADTGIYSQLDNSLSLLGGVNVFHERGYEIRTASATMDLKAGSVSGDDPIKGQGAFGEVEAEGFRVYDKGQRIIFTGKSKLVLHSDKGKLKK